MYIEKSGDKLLLFPLSEEDDLLLQLLMPYLHLERIHSVTEFYYIYKMRDEIR